MPRVVIDYDKCTTCHVCEEECTVRLLVLEDDIVRPRADRSVHETREGSIVEYEVPGCSNCRACQIQCTVEAISIRVNEQIEMVSCKST